MKGKVTRAFTQCSKEARVRNTPELSGGEIEILQLVALGLSNAQIGAKLFITDSAVTQYVQKIFDKLEVTDRMEMVLCAIHDGLIKKS